MKGASRIEMVSPRGLPLGSIEGGTSHTPANTTHVSNAKEECPPANKDKVACCAVDLAAWCVVICVEVRGECGCDDSDDERPKGQKGENNGVPVRRERGKPGRPHPCEPSALRLKAAAHCAIPRHAALLTPGGCLLMCRTWLLGMPKAKASSGCNREDGSDGKAARRRQCAATGRLGIGARCKPPTLPSFISSERGGLPCQTSACGGQLIYTPCVCLLCLTLSSDW